MTKNPIRKPASKKRFVARFSRFVAGAEGCALVVVPGWALEASAIASAVDDGLRDFFGAGSEEAADAERERALHFRPSRRSSTNAATVAAAESNVSNFSNQIFHEKKCALAAAARAPGARRRRGRGAPRRAAVRGRAFGSFFGNKRRLGRY